MKYLLPAIPTKTELTEHEAELLRLVAAGLTQKEIAERLGISENTVRNRITRLCELCRVGNRVELVIVAMRHGWLDLEAVWRDMAERMDRRARTLQELY